MTHVHPLVAAAVAADMGPANDSGVRIVRDRTTGAAAIVLDADAVDALDAFLDGLGATHDLIADAYDAAGVEVILAIRGMLRA